VNPFETETMAELCVRQGHVGEALDIYRRLIARVGDPNDRARIQRRITMLDRGDSGVSPTAALTVPGVRAHWESDRLTVEWHLPDDTDAPAVQILLVHARDTGVATETRTVDVDHSAGNMIVAVKGLHSARVAAGRRTATGFVPLARG
jgi:hypothetical protein